MERGEISSSGCTSMAAACRLVQCYCGVATLARNPSSCRWSKRCATRIPPGNGARRNPGVAREWHSGAAVCFEGPANPQASNTQAGGYAQDNWSLTKRLVLQAGLRTDWDRFTQSAMLEPRLSGNVLPFGDDGAKFSLGWGIYNAPLNLAVIEQSLDQRQIDTFFNSTGTLPSVDRQSASLSFQRAVCGSLASQPRARMAAENSAQHARWSRIAGAQRLPRFCLCRSDAGTDRRNFSFAGHAQRPLSVGDRYAAPHFLRGHGTVRRLYTFARAQQSSAQSWTWFDLLCRAAIRAARLGRAEPPADLGWTPTHIWKIQFSYFSSTGQATRTAS